jgi:gliding motility-associated-like protein
VDTSGFYSVEITSSTSCVIETRNFNILEAENPIIEKIESDGYNIVVETTNLGNFLYSLDGIIFQTSNVFRNVDGGLHTIYVKNQYCSNTVNQQHFHFYIPKFFTPNNDGENDAFNISGMGYFSSSYISIYDRFGKLLKNSRNSQFSWDGTYNGQPMPSSDYWYVIVLDNEKITGHFTLKR